MTDTISMLDPLLGSWVATADGPPGIGGTVRCVRTFSTVLGGAFVALEAKWEFPSTSYAELALFGIGETGRLTVWSFTSDGKTSVGERAGNVGAAGHLVFVAQMPAGRARMTYVPTQEGFRFLVESEGPTGWTEFVRHAYEVRRPNCPLPPVDHT